METIDRATFERLCAVVQAKLRKQNPIGFVVAAIGGLPTAEIANALGVPCIAIPTYKDEQDVYRIGRLICLRSVLPPQVFAAGDEATDSGELLVSIRRHIEDCGGVGITYTLVARRDGLQANVIGSTCEGKPLPLYWKTQQLTPGVKEMAARIEQLRSELRPNALIAVGRCFTAAAELAKKLDISGRYVGGLPVFDDGQPDTRWAHIGDCEGLRVLVMGDESAILQPVIDTVIQRRGSVVRV